MFFLLFFVIDILTCGFIVDHLSGTGHSSTITHEQRHLSFCNRYSAAKTNISLYRPLLDWFPRVPLPCTSRYRKSRKHLFETMFWASENFGFLFQNWISSTLMAAKRRWTEPGRPGGGNDTICQLCSGADETCTQRNVCWITSYFIIHTTVGWKFFDGYFYFINIL